MPDQWHHRQWSDVDPHCERNDRHTYVAESITFLQLRSRAVKYHTTSIHWINNFTSLATGLIVLRAVSFRLVCRHSQEKNLKDFCFYLIPISFAPNLYLRSFSLTSSDSFCNALTSSSALWASYSSPNRPFTRSTCL